jgi:DNA-directed RNA polymerase subunit M/transcription elongation factor TFIIS
MTADNLSLCIRCGSYVHPESGKIREDGIVCDDCERIENKNEIAGDVLAVME